MTSRVSPDGRRRVGRTAVCLFLTIAFLAITAPAHAQTAREPVDLASEGLVRLDSIEGGALLFHTNEPGWYVLAPTLHTDIDISVSGALARTTVSQHFRNAADVFVDGKYVFPLPEGAAVDTLRMRVGDRWIEGAIEEREEAEAIFEAAREAGQVASLVEQDRPNVFTTSVANIAPSAEVVVQIEYQETLSPRDGRFGLRVPLVVAPRYVPESQRPSELRLTDAGWEAATIVDPDAASVVTPLVDPRTEPDGSMHNSVEVSVDLEAGYPIGAVESVYHDIDVRTLTETSVVVELQGPVPSDRDFYLSWSPDVLAKPYTAAFTEQLGGERHYVALLTPPTEEAIGDTRQPREVIFVQDTSGSMGGDSLVQAKAGLVTALERLNPDDTFNIIEFNSRFTVYANDPLPATDENITMAVRWVDGLVSTGGTEMLPALASALNDDDPNDGRLRQVIFLTDGVVSNELEMLELIATDLGQSRLFTVGIGSAPNSYFMTSAATQGRGSFVFIGDISEVNAGMEALFAKIETPAIVDIVIADPAPGVQISPSPIPDLYAGDPVVVTIRAPEGVDLWSIDLVGTRGSQAWQTTIDLAAAEVRPGVSKLWAREHIRDLEGRRVSPEVDEQSRQRIDDTILATALEFGIVTRLTSLVAVDVQITRPAEEQSVQTEVATNLPAGWNPEQFFATSDRDVAFTAAELDRLNAADDAARVAEAGAEGLPFAATGAGWQLQAWFGLALIAASGVLLLLPEPRRDDDEG